MYRHRPIVAFELSYAQERLFCEAVMRPASHKIYFNGLFIVEIENDFEYGWSVTNGTILPGDIVDNIGDRIESRFT